MVIEDTRILAKTNYDQSKFSMLMVQLDIVPRKKEYSTTFIQIDLRQLRAIDMVEWHRKTS